MTFEEKIKLCKQFRAGVMTFASGATTITDEQALSMASLFPEWKSETDYTKGQIVTWNEQLYHIEQDVTSLDSQSPDMEGMLAIYRPIDVGHAGTLEDPIPWISGMDCYAGKYYSYKGKVYKVADGGTMKPCVWPPDTDGLWQWELVSE